MLRVLLLAACLVGLLLGCDSPQPAEQPKALLVINQEKVTRQEFLQAFQRTLHPDQQLSKLEQEELQRSFLVQLIDRKLMYAEARRLKITVSPEELQEALTGFRRDYPDEAAFQTMLSERGLSLQAWQVELEENLVMEKLLEQAVYSRITISEMEIANYYEAHREDFNRPAQVRARQIVVADEAEGRRLLGLLRQGEDFAALAREHSMTPDAEAGGDLGFFGQGKMPPVFDAVVFDLPVGRLSDLVKSDYGYHIFLVEEKRSAARLGKQEASAEIRGILETRKREEVYQAWLQGLRAEARITVSWDQLENDPK